MSTSEGQFKAVGRPRPTFAATAMLGLLIAACGGGGGGGNGDAAYTLRISFANETTDTATLQMDDGTPQEVESCKGDVFSVPMPATDWLLTVNGEPAIDSLDLDPTDLDNDLAARLWLHEDGQVEIQGSILPGGNISPPTALTICT